MLRLVLGRAGSGKTRRVLQELIQDGQARPQVLMVPEQQSHQTERALSQMGGCGVSLYAEVLSFSRLSNRVFQAAGGLGEPELDAGGRLLLMYRAVQSVAFDLRVYNRPSRRPGFLQSMLATVDELKSCCVTPQVLMQAGEETEAIERDKLLDLGLIYGAYNAMTLEHGLDPRDRLTRVADKLRTCPWAAGKSLWLDGFTDFTPQQGEVLRQLMAQAHQMTLTLTCDDLAQEEGSGDIFLPARKTARWLMRLAKQEHIPVEVVYLSGGDTDKLPPLQALEGKLFAQGTIEPIPCQGAVRLFQAATPRSEVEWTAASILQLARDEGLRFREIGVVARNYGTYRDLIESIFPRYGVPVFSSAMTDILEKPVLALIGAALDTVAGGYTYDDVFRYLKTGLTGLGQEDCDLLENYCLLWNLRGSRWTQGGAWRWHPRGYGQSFEPEDEALLARLDDARRQVSLPLETLRKNKDQTGRGQAVALYSFLEEINLPHHLAQRMEQLRLRGQAALGEEYRQLWGILCTGLEQCAHLLGDCPMKLDEFSQIFRLVLSQYDVGSIPVSLDQVTAGEMTRQSGHRVKALFLLGADDASLPQIAAAPGLLSDDERALLADYGLQLGQTSQDMLYREMTTVYLTCTRPSQRLVVSYPAQGGGGDERRPSFLVDRLALLFSDLVILQEGELNGAFRLSAVQPALEQAGRNPLALRALEGLEEYTSALQRLKRGARWERGRLSPQAVERLYGRRVAMSASRMDQYKSCHFSYFMRYGLNAQPRKLAGFSAPEYGTFVHYVLEKVLQDPIFSADSEPVAWDDDCKKHLRRLTKQAVDDYVKDYLGGLSEQTPRFQYLFSRLLRGVQVVVENAAEELLHSSFRPIAFELGFGRRGELPPVEFTVDGVSISISGFVDRVDGWVHNERLYLRVVDYKTGRKSFDLTEIYNGIGLQMLLYLFTLQQKGEELYRQPVEGAGVLYLPARQAVIQGRRGMDEESLRRALDKELVRRGLVLDDPEVLSAMETAGEDGFRFLPLKVSSKTGAITGEALASAAQLGKLGGHIQRVLEDICKELAQGNIAADPFWRGQDKNACRYCDYAAACHFEEGRGGDCRRWLSGLDAEEFWQRLGQST